MIDTVGQRKGSFFLSTDFIDRVINLKLYFGAKGEDIVVLRSDYELYDKTLKSRVVKGNLSGLNKSEVVVRRCRFKPSIKIEYNQPTGNTQLNLNIYVDNFFILDKTGMTKMQFGNSEYPLKTVEIQMGYAGQFIAPFAKNETMCPTLDEYLKMECPAGVKQITCNVNEIMMSGTPPNYTMHIHSYVGSSNNTYKPLQHDTDNTLKPEEEISGGTFECFNFFDYAFQNVTRRFSRRQIDMPEKDKMLSESDASEFGVQLFFSESFVLASDGFSRMSGQVVFEAVDGSDVTAPVKYVAMPQGDTTAQAINKTMRLVSPKVRIQPLSTGDYLIYMDSDVQLGQHFGGTEEKSKWYVFSPTLAKLARNTAKYKANETAKATKLGLIELTYSEVVTFIGKPTIAVNSATGKAKLVMQDKARKMAAYNLAGVLPAVYNVDSSDSLASITAPYFSWVEPFQDFTASSGNMAKTGMVDYWANMLNHTNFQAISMSFAFATVEDLNEMTILANPWGKKA
jgi:hypothetical protein